MTPFRNYRTARDEMRARNAANCQPPAYVVAVGANWAVVQLKGPPPRGVTIILTPGEDV